MRYHLILDVQADYVLIDTDKMIRTEYTSDIERVFEYRYSELSITSPSIEAYMNGLGRILVCEFDEELSLEECKDIYPEVFV